MRILIVGYGGEGNVGDDVLGTRLFDLVESVLPDASIVAAWGDRSPWETPDVPTIGRSLEEVLDAVDNADALLIGPGGILHNARSFGNWHRDRGLAYYDAITAKAASFGIPIAAIGIGVGPLAGATSQRFATRILERCGTITVRDDYSLNAAAGLGISDVSVGPDLTMSEPKTVGHPNPSGHTTLGICLRPWINSDSTQRVAETVASAIDLLAASGHIDRVVGLPMSSSPINSLDDRWATQNAIDSITAPIETAMVEVANLADLDSVLENLDVMVSMRLHGVILARLVGTPSIGIEYDPKVRTATAQLGAATVPLDFGAGSLAETVREALDHGRAMPSIEPPTMAKEQLAAFEKSAGTPASPSSDLIRQIESLMLAAGV